MITSVIGIVVSNPHHEPSASGAPESIISAPVYIGLRTSAYGPVETIGIIPNRLANLWFRGGVRLTAGVEVRNSTLAVDVGTNADCADVRGGGIITKSTISGCWTGVDIEDGGTGVVALSKITNNRLNVLVTQGASADLGGFAQCFLDDLVVFGRVHRRRKQKIAEFHVGSFLLSIILLLPRMREAAV